MKAASSEPDVLPSPAASTSPAQSSILPQPRPHPLRAGSTKEETARRYVESRLMYVSRRYTKKFQPAEIGDQVVGYRSIRDVCKDLSELVDVLWLSSTPSLQIPYLLNVALSISTYVTAFPTDPTPTFALLQKLDHAFASLLKGQDHDTGDLLPGFQGGRGGMSRTEMVRCKSLVEGMRVLIVEIMGREPEAEDHGQGKDSTDTEFSGNIRTDEGMSIDYTDNDSGWDDDDERGHAMDVARVFEKTIVQLGDSLRDSTRYDVGS